MSRVTARQDCSVSCETGRSLTAARLTICASSYGVRRFGMHTIWPKLCIEQVNLRLFEGLR